jgi:hypothetical protein
MPPTWTEPASFGFLGMERSSRALLAALWPLTVGHLLAMLLVILPFALLVALVEWQRQIQIGASLLVIGFGIFRLVDRRHPFVSNECNALINARLNFCSMAARRTHP